VLFAFPWGEPGSSLEHYTGPDTWQREFLDDLGHEVRDRQFNGKDPVQAIRMAVSSGHGVGKPTLVAWLVLWIMSTRPVARGTITANTLTQLETKTWAQIRRWAKLAINAHWFQLTERFPTAITPKPGPARSKPAGSRTARPSPASTPPTPPPSTSSTKPAASPIRSSKWPRAASPTANP